MKITLSSNHQVQDRPRILKMIRDNMKPEHRVFVEVPDPRGDL